MYYIPVLTAANVKTIIGKYRLKIVESINKSNLDNKSDLLNKFVEEQFLYTFEEIDSWGSRMVKKIEEKKKEMKRQTSEYLEVVQPVIKNFLDNEKGINFSISKNKRPRLDGRKT